MSIKSRLLDFLSKFKIDVVFPEAEELDGPPSFWDDLKKPLTVREDSFFYLHGPDGIYELPLPKGTKITISNFRLTQSDFGSQLFECEPKEKYDN